MPLDTTFVRGMPTGLYVSPPAATGAKATAPTAITFTAASAASAGATELSLTASVATTLEKNQILVFDDVPVLVTAQTAVETTSTAVPVDAVEGLAGDGIPDAIAENDTATWDGMFRVLGTESSDLTISEQTNPLTSVTYDSGQSMTWDEQEITSRGWTIPRTGRFKPTDAAYLAVRTAALTKREVWVKRILADEDGDGAQIEQGRATITGFTATAPANGIVDANWTFQGQGQLAITEPS